MLLTNSNFDTEHDLPYKTPIYLIHFDGETIDYANHVPGSPSNTVRSYLVKMSGMDQKKTPQEGKSSIGGVKFTLLDFSRSVISTIFFDRDGECLFVDRDGECLFKDAENTFENEITKLLSTDTDAYFQNRKVVIKAGYLGLDESDMLTIANYYRVQNISLSSDGTSYNFECTDPMKKFDKILFRGADESNITIHGNAIDILLRILTSSGTAGANGDYDVYAEGNGLGMDSSEVDISDIESIRDDWFPGNSHWMMFTLDSKEKARDFFEKELFKPLNLTPVITNQGKFTIKPFKPPIPTRTETQSFDMDVITEEIPRMDFNLVDLVNEVDFYYDHDGDDFTTVDYHQEADSLANRGIGKKPITIKSKGLFSSPPSGRSLNVFGSDVSLRRAESIFNRYSTPPIKIKFSTLFYQWLSEVGDIIPFTHDLLPNIISGVRGYSNERMEIINVKVDWSRGRVNFELLATGFAQNQYSVVTPTMTITSGTSATEFEVSSDDASKYSNFSSPVVDIYDSKMKLQVSNKIISDISGTTITIENLGVTPSSEWIVIFSSYDNCTEEQKRWGFTADSNNKLGSDQDNGQLILP